MVRRIAHIDMDAFFVTVELLEKPELKGKPVVVGGTKGRGVVTSASYEARVFGIHSGMPTARARHLCPEAVFLRSTRGVYGTVSKQIRSILGDYTPDVEFTSVGEGYIDITGTERLFDSPLQLCSQIKQRILVETGCTASIGIAGNRLCAKVACKVGKPNGLIEIMPSKEQVFLSRLPTTLLPGAGGKLGERLRKFGITSIGQLAQAGERSLFKSFGKHGAELYFKALGQPLTKMPTYELMHRKSVGHDRTLNEDTTDMAFLERLLFRLCERCCRTLRDESLVCRSVAVKIRLADFRTYTPSKKLLSHTDNDLEIFRTARSILRGFQLPRIAIRMVGVSLSTLSPQCQWGLYDETAKFDALFRGIDSVRDKHGFDSLVSGFVLGDEESEKYGGDRRHVGAL